MQDVWIDLDSRITGERAKLHALWLPQPRADAPTLLYLHGARWDVRGSAPRMRRLHELDFAVLGVDYRGFGRSAGGELPSEQMAYEDARAARDWLGREGAPQARRFVFGHWLGGAIAADLAAQVEDLSGLIMEGSFSSLRDLLATFTWGWLPVGPLLTQRFEAAERLPRARRCWWCTAARTASCRRRSAARSTTARASPSASCSCRVARTTAPTGWSSRSTHYRVAVRELFGVEAAGRAGE